MPQATVEDPPKAPRRHTLQSQNFPSLSKIQEAQRHHTDLPIDNIKELPVEAELEIETPGIEYEPWLTRCVLACQEGKINDLIDAIRDYMRSTNVRLLVEDIAEFLNAPHNGK